MKTGNRVWLGGVEAGGTKCVLALGPSPTQIVASHTIPTETPERTLSRAVAWFEEQGRPAALGIASFGPVDLLPQSPSYGHIMQTPKAGWAGCDIVGTFTSGFGIPLGFDTDVNAAALAERRFGAGWDGASLTYLTVGTGIGGGLVIDDRPVHGAAHPEMGHALCRRHPADMEFPGLCPHHGDCLEGLASGPAIIARWGASLSQLPPGHEGHAIIAFYLAQACHNLIAAVAPEVIVLGGGVMKTPGLLDAVRAQTEELGRGYFPGRHRIEAPALGDEAGVTGALLLAEMACDAEGL